MTTERPMLPNDTRVLRVEKTMSGDSRPIATDALHTLGMIIDEHQKRDAIHLAVLPVVAVVKVFPGQDVGIVPGGAGPSQSNLGIVDPFLTAPVQPGERFWLILYPRTISSLRHVWSHPAVDDEPEQAAFAAPPAVDKKAESEAWLRDFCENSGCPTYEDVMAAIREGGVIRRFPGSDYEDTYSITLDQEYIHVNGQDAHGEIPDEFWDHVEVVTGKPAPSRAKYFSCSC